MHRLPICLVAVAALLVGAAGASAHADVTSSNARHSAKTRLTVVIEHGCSAEGASVDAVDRVALQVPGVFASVSPVTIPGWRASMTMSGAAHRITWTRTGATSFAGRLSLTAVNPAKPGTYPLPVVEYCGKASIAWIQKPVGGVEPEHPLPVLKVT